uniref:Uncharacterized protein n=1 Tax=Pristionchus pacificus TaxID=54126 RepID=A0A8R1UX77_PRIPA
MISLLLGVTFLFGVSQACLPMKPSSGPGLPVPACQKCAEGSFYKKDYKCTLKYDDLQPGQTCIITPASQAFYAASGCTVAIPTCPAGSSYYVNSILFDNQPDPKHIFSEEIFKALTPVISCGTDSKWKISILGENEQRHLAEFACYNKV